MEVHWYITVNNPRQGIISHFLRPEIISGFTDSKNAAFPLRVVAARFVYTL